MKIKQWLAFLRCVVSPAYRRKWIQQYNEQYNERHKGSAP